MVAEMCCNNKYLMYLKSLSSQDLRSTKEIAFLSEIFYKSISVEMNSIINRRRIQGSTSSRKLWSCSK